MKFFMVLTTIWASVSYLSAQSVFFAFASPEVTEESGSYFYEVDVTVRGSSSFLLGSGQLYFNYNTSVLGSNIVSEVTVSHPEGYLLSAKAGILNFYNTVKNNNTSSRFSFSWQQSDGNSGCLGESVSTSAGRLFRLRLPYLSGQEFNDPGLCFENGSVFTRQTFTACGPADDCGNKDCVNYPAQQLTNDAFDCTASSILPVELISFEARALASGAVALNWETATELNNDYFAVERSVAGLAFEELFRVKGAGTTTDVQNYQALDEAPFPGDNYYRLRQVDFDGSLVYSEVRSVHLTPAVAAGVEIYPNPVSERLYIRFAEHLPADARMELLDISGHLVLSRQITQATPAHALDIRHLPKGAYLLQINQAGETLHTKIMVQ